jgi:hypothetical protein
MKDKLKKPEETIDFIGIGAARSATTWVNKCLEEHPNILMSSQKSHKELNFFNSNIKVDPIGVSPHERGEKESYYENGLEWYLGQFPEPQKGKIRGEFSVSYLPDTLATKRIYNFNPNIKIVAMLRNPVEAINSAYHWLNIRADGKPLKIEDIVNRGFLIQYYKYYKHLKRYFDLFPKENIKVMITKDIGATPLKEIQDLYKFLGVESNFSPPSLKKKVNKAVFAKSKLIKKLTGMILNTLWTVNLKGIYRFFRSNKYVYQFYKKTNLVNKNYEKFDEKTRKKIKEMLMEDIENLEKLIDKDLSAWK